MTSKIARTAYISVTALRYSGLLLIGRKEQAQKLLFERLYQLGGVYIKFLQMLAIREDTKSVQISGLKDSLAVFDQAAYEYIDIVNLLRAELGIKATYLSLESIQPFAAGSFAQVYGARLNNERVVIKVLRPSVVTYLRFDMGLLGWIVKIISVLQPDGMINMKDVFNDYRQTTLAEIDYEREAETALRLSEQLASNPVIYIPKTYTEFSTRHIIVQERITGLPLTQLLSSNIEDKPAYAQKQYRTDLTYVMEELAYELLAASLKPGGTHGDPHPGNVYLMSDNRIALIDFGISARVERNQAELMGLLTQYVALYKGEFAPAEFTKAMLRYFVPELTHSLQTLSTYFGARDLVQKLLDEIGSTVTHTFQEQGSDPVVQVMLSQYRMANLFAEVINKDNRFGLKLNIETTAFLRSTNIYLNMVHRLGCDKQVLRRAYERVLIAHSHLQTTPNVHYDTESVDRSFHEIAGWFDRLQYSDPSLHERLIKVWRTVS